MSDNQQQRQSAAVTISEEERRRLAAFRDILSGSGGDQQKQTDEATATAAKVNNSNNNKAVDKFSDDDEDDEEQKALERQARAAWAQSTPEKRQDKDEIWDSNDNNNKSNNQQQGQKGGDSSASKSSPEGKEKPLGTNVAVFSSQTTTAGWSPGGVNVVSPVRKNNKTSGDTGSTPEVHQPKFASRKSKTGTSPDQTTQGGTTNAAASLSVQARPFIPKHQSIEKTFSPDLKAAAEGSSSPSNNNNNNKTSPSSSSKAGGRRAPPASASQPDAENNNKDGKKEKQPIFFGSTSNAQRGDKPLDFMRWMSGAYRGPLQDPSFCINTNFPLWMHLAVLPDQCGAPSAKRVLRAWAVQFGLESVEYWTWRNMVQKNIRVPVDCTEPDVLSHQPVAEYLKSVLKWYDRLSHYRDIKIITDEEKANIERLASRSRDEFLRYLKAYTPSAKAAFELMAQELEALEEEAAKHEAAKSKIKLGGNVTSAVSSK